MNKVSIMTEDAGATVIFEMKSSQYMYSSMCVVENEKTRQHVD